MKYLEVHLEPVDIRDMNEAYVRKINNASVECGKNKYVFRMLYSPISLSKMKCNE